MQAIHIHTSQAQVNIESASSVHGQNKHTGSENSFDSMLEKKINENLQAKEGPPEHQKTESSQQSFETSEAKSTEQSKNGEKGDDFDSHDTGKNKPDVSKDLDILGKKLVKETNPATEKSLLVHDAKFSSKIVENDASEKLDADEISLEESVLLEQEALLVDPDTAIIASKDEDVSLKENLISEELLKEDNSVDSASIISVSTIDSTKLTETVAVKNLVSESTLPSSEDGTESKKVLADIPTISVEDQRTVSLEAKQDGNFVKSVSYDGNGNATMDLSLNNSTNPMQTAPGTIVNADGSVQQNTVSNAQQFGTMFSSEIQSNAAELVKTGSIVLKDGNVGTINLILHPEEFGNVKIQLEISDNVLTGKITVASEEAFNAFKSNITSLKEAFDAKGFETSGFDLSWNGEERSSDDGNQQKGSKNPYGNRYEENLAILNDVQGYHVFSGQNSYIDLIA